MLKSDMLLNILSPEAIDELGLSTIDKIKNLGKQNKYLTVIRENNPYSIDQQIEYGAQRIKELSRGYITKELDKVGKTLFCSEIKFIDDEKFCQLLNSKGISIEDIMECNELIKMCQYADIEYTMAMIKLEKKYDGLKQDQAIRIVRLKPALINTNYELNQDDIQLYSQAQKFLLILKGYEMRKEKSINILNENKTIKKLVLLAKDHFGISEENFFILMNKINELIITNPEKLMISSNQKQLKKED